MRVFLLLLVCVFASAYALPRYSHIVTFDDDVDDDADVEDEPYDSFDGMFTFPTGGPGGPPKNDYLGSGSRPYGRADMVEMEDETDFYTSNFSPYFRYAMFVPDDEEVSSGVVPLARGLARSSKKGKPVKAVKVEEEDEEEDDDPDQDDDDDDEDFDDDSGFSVPDFNELFPNPEGRPRGPNDYDAYVKHSQKQSDQPASAPQRHGNAPPPRQYGNAPPPQQHRDGPPPQQYRDGPPPQQYRDGPPPQQYRDGPPPQQYRDGPPPQQYRDGPPPQQYRDGPPPQQYRDGPPPQQYRDGPPPQEYRDGPQPQQYRDGPPPQQYRDAPPPQHYGDAPHPSQQYGSGPPPQEYRNAPPPQNGHGPSGPPPPRRYRVDLPIESSSNEIDDAVVVTVYDGPQYRMAEEEDDDQENEYEEEEDADDDVDWSVPSYDQLFPTPGNKPPVYGGMKSTWNQPPGPPRSRRLNRYGRFIRLLHSPMHDSYNPEYVINPQIALDRRNERMRHRYNNPRWQFLNARTPYNYKPILSQAGHWGDPREHDYNPVSQNHYLGGVYNGKTYY